jgi:murein DD-endopeptidase MepM/ murein hydrolase activator NlpD
MTRLQNQQRFGLFGLPVVRGLWSLALPVIFWLLILLVTASAAEAASVPAAPQRIVGPPVAKPGPPALRRWVADRVTILEGLLVRSGLDVEELIERADGEFSTGQGGPLVLAPGDGSSWADSPHLERLQRVSHLIELVPLASPMETYRLTSGFGLRRDPLNRRRAVHEGQDFGGPRNAPVFATAPGTVVEAGRAGAYGIMVEIDHGMGIRTRYAHLKKALVRVGQQVPLRRRIGVMGNTGRSTGAHLHYEVRLDGRALDPANFLAAGGQLRQLVGR